MPSEPWPYDSVTKSVDGSGSQVLDAYYLPGIQLNVNGSESGRGRISSVGQVSIEKGVF